MNKKQEKIMRDITDKVSLYFKSFISKPIDDDVFENGLKLVADVMEPFLISKKIDDYGVIFNDVNNTEKDMKNGKFHLRVYFVFDKHKLISNGVIFLDFDFDLSEINKREPSYIPVNFIIEHK